MTRATADSGSTQRRKRASVAAREIRDAVEAIAVDLGGQSASRGLSAESLRDRAVATALAIMAQRSAVGVGLHASEPCFGCDPSLGLARTGLNEACGRIHGWMDRHGQGDPLGSAYEILLETELIRSGDGNLCLDFRTRGRRSSAGAFYTPSSLVEFTLDRGLEPVLDVRVAGFGGAEAAEILVRTAVLDPAVGGGRFLVAAARRIAARVKALGGGDRLVEVLLGCVHGIDIDPIAAEICRLQLWIAARDPRLSPSAFAANIRTGNALLGTSRAMVVSGIPDEAYRVRPGDEPSACASLRKRNREERGLPREAYGSPDQELAADLWCAAFLARKSDGGSDTPTTVHLYDAARLTEAIRERTGRIAETERFFHADLAFAPVFARGGFDVIVGNPPFLNQLESATAHDPGRAALLRSVSCGLIRGYADTSAVFLERCSHWLAPGGRIALVQPRSVLTARDAEPIRRGLLLRCSLTDLWVARERIFGSASVHVCLPVLERSGPRRGNLARFVGKDFQRLSDRAIDQDDRSLASTWAPLAGSACGVPEIEVMGTGTIGDLAEATADFRDQYYGLDGFLVEDAEVGLDDRRPDLYPKLVTAGLIDLAECRWGSRPTRMLKRGWNAPRIDRRRMASEGALASWIAERSRPKIILATQTKVLEAFVDEYGGLVPSIPLITITPCRAEDLWRTAAAISSPVASAVAFTRHDGAAMTTDAIKLSASQALRLPLPLDGRAWQQGAELLRAAHRTNDVEGRQASLHAFGHAMTRAYGLTEPDVANIERWWIERAFGPDRRPDVVQPRCGHPGDDGS